MMQGNLFGDDYENSSEPFCFVIETPCPSCKNKQRKLQWHTFSNGTRHIRKTCSCGRFFGWEPQTPHVVGLLKKANNERAN